MAEIVSPIPTGPIIPQEYQDQIDEARRKLLIAQMLQTQSMNFKGPQQIGPVAAKTSPLAGLANIAQAGLGGMMGANATADASAAKTRFETDQAGDLSRIFALPEDQQPQTAQTSKFPQNQAIGRAMQASMEKRREEGAKLASQAGDEPGAMGILNGAIPMKGYVPKTYPEPEIINRPDPNDPSGVRQVSYIKQYDKNGRQTLSPASSMTQTVNLPGKEGELAATREQSDLSAHQGQAQNAMQILSTADRVVNALGQGAVTGGGGDLKQNARKFFQAVGIDIPETGPTDLARTQLGGIMLGQINKLGRNPTDYDEKLMQKLVGSIDTDPTALPQLLSFMTAQAHKSLQDFNDFLQIKRNSPASKTYPGLYDTADVGVRTPSSLNGPLPYQMQVVQALKQAGGDITRFADPTGKPFSADSTFDIKPNPITPNSPSATGATPPVPKVAAPSGTKTAINPTTGEKLGLINGQWVPIQ